MAQFPSSSDFTAVVMQTDVQDDLPGGVGHGARPLLQSGLEGPAIDHESEAQSETPPAPALGPAPAPNGHLVQAQHQAESPNAQTPPLENTLRGRGSAYPSIGDEEVERVRNHHKLKKLFFPAAIQFALAMLTVLFSNAKNPVSFSAWILIKFATGCNIICYICSFSSIFMCRDSTGLGSRILYSAIYATSAFSYISIMGLLLPDKLNLGFTFLGCVACLPALFGAFGR